MKFNCRHAYVSVLVCLLLLAVAGLGHRHSGVRSSPRCYYRSPKLPVFASKFSTDTIPPSSVCACNSQTPRIYQIDPCVPFRARKTASPRGLITPVEKLDSKKTTTTTKQSGEAVGESSKGETSTCHSKGARLACIPRQSISTVQSKLQGTSAKKKVRLVVCCRHTLTKGFFLSSPQRLRIDARSDLRLADLIPPPPPTFISI